ncbi:DNA polymerase III subunit delta' [Gammaproteobacteria bacterium]
MSDPAILPWQYDIWEHLVARYRTGRLPHALLFSGPRGVGKTTLARCFAHTLLCEKPTDSGLACTTCPACRRLLAGSHPDFLWVQPEAKTRAEGKIASREERDGGNNSATTEIATTSSGSNKNEKGEKGGRIIRIDQIRALGEWFALKPHYGERKVALIVPAEQMNINAANSLLKTLEEPPNGALLMLVATHPVQLPATIRSRCQTLTFPPVATESALPWLINRGTGDREVAALLLALAEGGPLTALTLAQNGTLEYRLTLFEELEGVVTGRLAPVTVAQSWMAREVEQIIDFQWSWTADMIRLSLASQVGLANPDLAPRLMVLARQLGVRRLYALLDHLGEALRLVRGPTNPNLQLLLEDLLIPWRA